MLQLDPYRVALHDQSYQPSYDQHNQAQTYKNNQQWKRALYFISQDFFYLSTNICVSVLPSSHSSDLSYCAYSKKQWEPRTLPRIQAEPAITEPLWGSDSWVLFNAKTSYFSIQDKSRDKELYVAQNAQSAVFLGIDQI